jgi:drug/metabolite transporter (DMT)-like permease
VADTRTRAPSGAARCSTTDRLTAPHGLAAKHVVSVLALGVFATGLTFVLNYSLVRDVGATVTSTVAYVIPIVSTVLGIVALGEPLRWYEPVGAVIIVLGAGLAQAGERPAPARTFSAPRSTSRSPARSRTTGS